MVTYWITSSGLKLNSAKTKLLTISCKRFPPQLSIKDPHQSRLLSSVPGSDHPCHGPLTPVTKPENNLALYIETSIRRIVRTSPTCMYKSAAPLLQLCVGSVPQTYAEKLKRVQEFVATLSIGLWAQSYDYQVKWPTLSSRRKVQKLLLWRRILSGNSIVCPNVFTPHPSPDLHHSHKLPLYTPPTRTQAHLGSYFTNIVPSP